MTELRRFIAPEIIFGTGALEQAAQYAKNILAQKPLIVTDEGLINAGWNKKLSTHLKKHHINFEVFSALTPNPKDYEVQNGTHFYLEKNCDIIIALGGGSVMDCAKGIAILSSNKGKITDFEGVDQIYEPGPPLVCIPSTAGTSADVSQFAIITDSIRKTKIAIISKSAVPDLALIDPGITQTMDAKLTAETGMDALVHAFEAYVSTAASTITDINALKAIELIHLHLQKAVHELHNLEHRTPMMMASLLAGLAFSNASLGLVHGMAHSLGGLADAGHGACNAILLEKVVQFNYPHARQKYNQIANVLGLGNITSADKLTDYIQTLRRKLHIAECLADLNISKEHINQLAENAFTDPCLETNPVKPTINDIREIYEQAF